MNTKQQLFRRMAAFGLAVILIGSFLIGCAGTDQPFPHGVLDKIPQNANLIMLDQQGVPPATVYADALITLQNQHFQIVSSKNTLDIDKLSDILKNEPLIFSAKKQIQPDLAIKITADARSMAGGGRLIASVKWAPNVNDSVEQWKDARWTSGIPREAFFEGLEILRGTRYDAMDFDIGVAITPDQ